MHRVCPGCHDLVPLEELCPNGCARADGRRPTPRRLALEEVWHSARWKKLKRRVHVRDRWRCRRCGLHDPSGEQLLAHHAGGFAGPNDPRAWDEAEVLTLCLPCSGAEDGGVRV